MDTFNIKSSSSMILVSILMSILLFCHFNYVFAQNSDKQLSAYTVMGIFNFGDSENKMNEKLADQEGFDCKSQTDDTFGKTIFCTNEYDSEKDFYTFYLDGDQRFYMARIDLVYTGGDLPIDEIYRSVASNFDAIEMDPYVEGAFYDYMSKGSVSAECGIVNQNLYICMNSVAETDENYPFVSVHYVLPAFVEAYDKGLSVPFHQREQVAMVDPYNVIGEVFHFGDDGNFVMEDMSSREGLHCEPKNDPEFGKVILCNVDVSDYESDQYTFYFSDEELLYMVGVDMFYKGNEYTIIELFDQVADHFSEVEMLAHNQGKLYERIRQGTEVAACGDIVDQNMVACVSATEKTDNNNPFITLYYVDIDAAKRIDAGESK